MTKRLAQRVALEVETFETEQGETVFRAYAGWLSARGVDAATVRRLGKHAEALRKIAKFFDAHGEIAQVALLDCLGTEGARRTETVISFLTTTRRLAWSDAVARDWADARRIDNIC